MGRDDRDRDRSAGDGHPDHGVAQPAPAATLVLHAGAAVSHLEEGAAEECAGGDEEAGQRLLRFGDDGKLALECLAGPPQQRLDGSDLDALMVRDLLVGPPRALAHGEHVSVARRQAVEGAVDELAIDRGQDDLLGRIFTGDADRVLCGQFQVVGRRAARAAAQHVRADIPRDHRQPRVETPFAGEARQRLPRAGERFLRCVLGLVALVQPAETEAEEPLVVAGIEVAECGGVTRLAALDEHAITVQVDVVAETRQLLLAKRQCLVPPPFDLVSGGRSHYVRTSTDFEGLATVCRRTGVDTFEQQS